MSTRDEILAALAEHPDGLTSKELAPKCPAAECDPQIVGRVIALLRTENVIHPGTELRDGGTIWIFGPEKKAEREERHSLPYQPEKPAGHVSEAARAIAAMRKDKSAAVQRPGSGASPATTPPAPARPADLHQEPAMKTIRERIEAVLKEHGPMDSRTMRKRGLKHDALGQYLADLVERKIVVRLGGGPRSSIYGLPGQKLGDAASPPQSRRAARAETAQGAEAEEGQEGKAAARGEARGARAGAEDERPRRLRDQRGGRARHRGRGAEGAPGRGLLRAPAQLHRAHEAGLVGRVTRRRNPETPPRRFWSAVEDAEFREIYPHVRTDAAARVLNRTARALYARAKSLGLKKTAEYLASPEACRLRRENSPGVAYRYPKGHVPANKGLRRPGWSPGRMRETQFKKGQRSGMAAAHHMPIGATRLVEGYVMLKVADVPNVPYTVNWKLLHILNWERANGRPLPEGHCLWFRDGNRANVEASNLELITRAENMRRNTLHNYPKPIVRAVMARGALNRRINRMERERGAHA